MEDGINGLDAYKVIQGFKEIVPVAKEVILTLKACKNAEESARQQLEQVISMLSGNIVTLIKVGVSEAVTIVANKGALTTDAQAVGPYPSRSPLCCLACCCSPILTFLHPKVVTCWKGGDYQGSGKVCRIPQWLSTVT